MVKTSSVWVRVSFSLPYAPLPLSLSPFLFFFSLFSRAATSACETTRGNCVRTGTLRWPSERAVRIRKFQRRVFAYSLLVRNVPIVSQTFGHLPGTN